MHVDVDSVVGVDIAGAVGLLGLLSFLSLHQLGCQALYRAHDPVSLVLPPCIQYNLVPILDEPHLMREVSQECVE